MRGLFAAVLAMSFGLSALAGPAMANAKADALKKCEAIHDKEKHDACVAAAEHM